LNKNKDFIFIDDKILDYNEKDLCGIEKSFKSLKEEKDFQEMNVNKFIKRKDFFITNLIREKLGTTNTNNNNAFSSTNASNQSNSPNNVTGKIIDNTIMYENFIKNLQKNLTYNSSNEFKKKIKKIKKLFNLKDLYNTPNTEQKNINNLYCTYNHTNENIISNSDEMSLCFSKRQNFDYNKILELNEKSQIPELIDRSESENSAFADQQKRKNNYLNEIKKFIKLHLKYIYSNNINKIEKEDKIILDFIFDNINESLYDIIKFWLFEEFLSVSESDSPTIVRRYEAILNEFISRIEKQEIFRQEIFSFENLFEFLIDIPQYNEKSIDFIIKHYPLVSLFINPNLELINTDINSDNNNNFNVDQIEKESEKNDENYINYIYIIYKRMKKRLTQVNQSLVSNSNSTNPNPNISFNAEALKSNYSELLKKLRNNLLNLTLIDNEKILKSRIKYISSKIIPLGDFDEIYEFSKKQFESLMKYAETPVNKNLVLSKYGLFFYLCLSYPDYFLNDFISECPKVYNQCTKPVCEILDKIIERSNINSALSIDNLRSLVQNCAEECTNIVLLVIKNIKSEVGTEKLFKEILNFYKRNKEPIEILLMLSIKINTFFKYVYEKLKISEGNLSEEDLERIFIEINNNSKQEPIISYLKKDEKINKNYERIKLHLLENIKDKIIFYIVFFIDEFIIKKNMHINKLNIFMRFFEKISLQGNFNSERLNENLSYLLELIKQKNFSELNFFHLINYLFDYFKENSGRNIIMSKYFILKI